MNLYLLALMDKPSVPKSALCPTCTTLDTGSWGSTQQTKHHIVPRSQGGHDGPTVYLCGHGTAGCHGMAEDKKLHFRFTDRWQWLKTDVPTKYERTLMMEGWRDLT